MSLRLPRPLLWIVMFICLAGPAQALFASGRIQGVLKDQKGAIVPGGTVEVKNLDSGVARSTVTDQEGRYVFDSLAAGRYRVAAHSPGFETAIRDNIDVAPVQDSIVDLVLSIAKTNEVVIVTAPSMVKPLVVETDPRAPRQPIPAHDGADYLKTVPGFSIIRKGGTDGDPILRGMAGSRLNILLDGQQILGGCGGRMDPPTAYIFPAAYERITVLKGPQTVLYGPGASAGTVLFERDMKHVDRPDFVADSSLILGNFGRHDEMIDARTGNRLGYVEAIATRSHSGNYSDGSGAPVHSFYTRWSSNAAVGWTPGNDTRLELSLARSNGRAAYADRAMDGAEFARDNLDVKFDKRNISSVLSRFEAQWYYNYIDHVMDNFSLRTPGTAYSVSNPDRVTAGGRLAVTLAPGTRTSVIFGADMQRNVHRFRGVMGKTSSALATSVYLSSPRAEDMRFRQYGFFGEATRILSLRSRLIGGFRFDLHKAVDNRMCVNATSCPGDSPLKNNTLGAADRKTLASGFGRFEYDLAAGRGTLYAGVGHAGRFPDYWERLKQDPVTLKSAFLSTRPEKTTQLDIGMLWKSESWTGFVSAFYGKVHDYILMKWSPAPSLTRNINATTMGGEGELAYRFAKHLRADMSLAYVRGNNDTDRKPLAQQPPLEGRIEVNYESPVYSFGALARLAGRQDRIDIGSGNIVANGMDIGPTPGFSIFSINGGYRLKKVLLITGGIDNLLNRVYAEHLSKAGAMVPGFVQTTRINEPGRTFWIKADFDIDKAHRE